MPGSIWREDFRLQRPDQQARGQSSGALPVCCRGRSGRLPAAPKFTRLYSFITQITPFEDADLYKLYHLSFLIKTPQGLAGTIDLSDDFPGLLCQQEDFRGQSLWPDASAILAFGPGGGYGAREDEVEELSLIISASTKGSAPTLTSPIRLFSSWKRISSRTKMMKPAPGPTPSKIKDSLRKLCRQSCREMAENERFAARIIDDEEFRTCHGTHAAEI